MPSHSHAPNTMFNKFSAISEDLGNESSTAGVDWTNRENEYAVTIGNTSYKWKDIKEKTKGGDRAHNNMPPYRVVEFIEFVGFDLEGEEPHP